MVQVPKRFVGLHAHDGFSTFDGMGLPREHFDFVIENTKEEGGVPALAITNHGHMSSYAHAYLYAKDLKNQGKAFKFLPGCEFYMHPDLSEWRRQYQQHQEEKEAAKKREKADEEHGSTVEDEEESKSGKFHDPLKRKHHLVVLAKHSKGLEHLFHVVSMGFMDGFYSKPRVDLGMLKRYKGDFIASTACIAGPLAYDVFTEFPDAVFDRKYWDGTGSYLGPQLVDDEMVRNRILMKMENTVDRIVDAFGPENFFLELQFNRLTSQHLVNRLLIDLSARTGVKLIATADSHYCNPDYWKERSIYQQLGWLNYKEYDPDKLPKSKDDLKSELYPKNALQMWETYKTTGVEYGFYDDGLVCDAIERTHDIAFNLLGDVVPDTTVKLPSWSVPAGKTASQALEDECDAGMKKMGLSRKPEYVARLRMELEVIKEKRFEEYFLTMKAITDVAAEHMLIGCGRGSAAGSLVNYVLGITQVDPLKYNLIFERFINRSRAEYPDIDSDFADRDLLIKLLKEKFGETNVIPISNYNTFQLKSLIKDISRFFHDKDNEFDGLSFKDVNDVLTPLDDEVRSKVLKQGDDKNLFELKLEHCMGDNLPNGEKPGPAMKRFREFMEQHPEVYNPIKILLHENKSLGKHAGGVIVSENVVERMPVIKSRKELQTPFVEGMHFKHLNELGWIKFDLLGLETLRIIQRCIELILRRNGVPNPTFRDVKEWYEKNLHPDVLDLNDQKVYEAYAKGKFAGLFQFTAKGAQMFIQEVAPKNVIDIATATSVYRPGPLTAKVNELYVNAKADPDSVHYPHQLVKKVLEKTYGCIIFQEQLMELGNVVGGLSLEECDKLRKVITKRSVSGASKAKEDCAKLEKKFIEGAAKQDVREQVSKDLFEKMAYFSGYGFNASHAVSYAIDSYMCAWLLTYYEAEWLCAYMETQDGQPEKRAKAIKELMSFGYEIVNLDINHATKTWTILPGKKFMPAMTTVKGVGDIAVDEVMLRRPYRTVYDLLWDEDGSWKHSKFNTRAFEALVRVGAFGSMDIVGPGKTFSSYQQMLNVIIGEYEWNEAKKKWTKSVDNNKLLKHKKKGRDNLDQLLTKYAGVPEWTTAERLTMSQELLGAMDLNLIISHNARQWLATKDIQSIDEYDALVEEGREKQTIYWFIVVERTPSKTKNGKPYLKLDVCGLVGRRYKVYLWGWDPKTDGTDIEILQNQAYRVCFLEKKTDWGRNDMFSMNAGKDNKWIRAIKESR